MPKLTICFALFLNTLPCFPSDHALHSDDSLKVKYQYKPVVITATKHHHAAYELPASVTLIDAAALAMSPAFSALETVQQHVPSFHLTEWGVMGFGAAGKSAGKLSMRGLGGSANTHILILRNGRPDFMGLMGCTIADEFTQEGIGRIEVIRGPGSFLYGSNATGGIINLLPKKRETPGYETHLSVGGGQYNTQTLSLRHGGQKGRFDYYLSAAHRNTDGHRAHADYSGQHYTLHLGMTPSPRNAWEFNGNLSDVRLYDPGPETAPAAGQWYDLLRGGFDLNGRQKNHFGEFNIKLHGNFGRHQFFDGWQSTDRTLGIMVYQLFTARKGQMATVGADIKRYGGRARDRQNDYGSHWITEAAPYLHLQQLMGRHTLISAGFRAEHHSTYGWEWLPKLGTVIHMTKQLSWRGSAAKGFRSPSIRELYFWMPANQALTPDRVWNVETALTWHRHTEGKFEIIFFQSEGSNLIQFSGPPPRWVNGGSYTLRGLESTWHKQWSPRLTTGITASWLKPGATPLLNAPKTKISTFLRFTTSRYNAQATVLHAAGLTGATYPNPSPLPVYVPLADYTLLHLALSTRLYGALELKLTLKNALNEHYRSMAGYPMPGRYLLLHFNYGWQS